MLIFPPKLSRMRENRRFHRYQGYWQTEGQTSLPNIIDVTYPIHFILPDQMASTTATFKAVFMSIADPSALFNCINHWSVCFVQNCRNLILIKKRSITHARLPAKKTSSFEPSNVHIILYKNLQVSFPNPIGYEFGHPIRSHFIQLS